jgi:hypothetical protein
MIQEYFLAQIWNGTQFFTADGKPLVGGKIATYSAGSMSLQAVTYTDNTGNVENTNPIILDSSGRIPQEIWLDINFDYQFVLYAPDGLTVIMVCDNIGTHDPYPDMTGHSGEFLQTTDGVNIQWTSPIPATLGHDGQVLKVSVGGVATEWGTELPVQDGHSGQFLQTVSESLQWATPSGSGGTGYPEYITELSNGYSMFSDGSYYYNWYVNDQQTSADVTGFSNGTASASQFTLNTPGSYKIVITGRIRSVNYPGVPAGALPTGAMLYGVQLIGTYANFDLSTHTSGTSAEWTANGIQNQLQWTDTFYVMMYDTNPVNFYIGVYANTVDGLFEYNPACMVSVLRTVGTPIQPN